MLPSRKVTAETPPLKVHRAKELKVYRVEKRTILEKLGWRGLVSVVWRATPFPICLISLPYGVAVYRGFLANSRSLKDVRVQHCRKCKTSVLFRWLRPRYHKAKYLLV